MAKPFIFGSIRAAGLLDDLDDITDDLPDAIEKADATTAEEAAEGARLRAAGMGSVQGHVASGITAQRSTITLNVNQQPAILGAEFGASRFRQFPPWKGSDDGYMLHPELNDDELIERYAEMVEDEIGL